MKNMMWACMLQLGMKMWPGHTDTKMEFERPMWDELTAELAAAGCNTILLDIGEGLKYDSYPEISAEDAWTKEEMKAEITRLNGMGFEVIPKLNFSTAHDMWLGDYAYMLGTPKYYEVCAALIAEICELFKPRFFHIGMDEENVHLQRTYDFIRVRQNDRWWNDLFFYIDCVEKGGARPMMWSDYARVKPDEFVEKCPKSVVHCNWYYYNTFDNMEEEKYRIRLIPFLKLEEKGFDQLPTGTCFWDTNFVNLERMAAYCRNTISEEHLFGILQTPWVSTQEKNRKKLMECPATIRNAREVWDNKREPN